MYADDITDELQQVVADFTAIEERCVVLLGMHAALVNKHLAVVSRTARNGRHHFLPISFLAGFWGQNFDVLTGTIEQGWPAFLLLSVGLSTACVVVTVILLKRRNWNQPPLRRVVVVPSRYTAPANGSSASVAVSPGSVAAVPVPRRRSPAPSPAATAAKTAPLRNAA